jgi:GxxExxY protein
MTPEDLKTGRLGDGSDEVIGALIEVHRELGPGLMEGIYEACVCHELESRGTPFEREVPVEVTYKGLRVGPALRADIIVRESLLIELEAVDVLMGVHFAQVLTYMKLTGLKSALLVNFNVSSLKQGLRRLGRQPPIFPSSDLPVKPNH